VTSFVVTAIGMTTSLGLDSADACAAARAGLVRLTEVDTLNATIEPAMAKEDLDGIPAFAGHMAPVVGSGCAGLAKLLALSRPALTELIGKMSRTPEGVGRTGLCVNVSDAFVESRFVEEPEGLDEEVPPTYAERWARTVAALPDRLRASGDLEIPSGGVGGIRRGACRHRRDAASCCPVDSEWCRRPLYRWSRRQLLRSDGAPSVREGGCSEVCEQSSGVFPRRGRSVLLVRAGDGDDGRMPRFESGPRLCRAIMPPGAPRAPLAVAALATPWRK
jgi:hypothetical protein